MVTKDFKKLFRMPIIMTMLVMLSGSCEWWMPENKEGLPEHLQQLQLQEAQQQENENGEETGEKGSYSLEILKSTNEILSFEIKMPSLKLKKMETEKDGSFDRFQKGEASDGFTLAGGGVDNYSFPETPIFTTFIALPIGRDSKADVEISAEKDSAQSDIRLYPIQKPKRDAEGAQDDESFRYDEEIYKNADVEHGLASLKPLNPKDERKYRDSNIYELKLNLVDYYPSKETLVTYSSIRVDVKFMGDVEYFSSTGKNSNDEISPKDEVDQWMDESPQVMECAVLNSNVLFAEKYRFEYGFEYVFQGARFIIITHPDFLSAANDLKAHKIARGISTIVVQTAPASTAASIKTYLQNAYNNWLVTPKWVLFIGDAEFIPTHYGNANTWDNADNAGDIYYGQFTGDDTAIPVFGIGRFPVDTQAQAQTIVDKIKAFETSPPSYSFVHDNPFYYTLTFAAEFQDTDYWHPVPDGRAVRWFAETSEHIRDYLVANLMSVTRIYKASSAHDPEFWEDGTPIPAYLQPPAFAWDGDKNDIINAVNEGTSILYHRDHGWWNGWGTPSFHTADLGSISVTNNEYPVVYSINCASGIFDNETDNAAYGSSSTAVYFAETFVRQSDGAIAVIGDTRSSSTVLNNDLAQGLFDATWPGYLTYGTGTSIRKLGDVLNHAKGYVKSKGYDVSSEKQELKIYNLLGDPTLEVKSRKPLLIVLEKILWLERIIEIPVLVKDPRPEPCLQCPPIIAVVLAQVGKEEIVLGRGILREIHEENIMEVELNEELIKKYEINELRVVVSGSEIPTLEEYVVR